MDQELDCNRQAKNDFTRICDNCGNYFERKKLDKRTAKIFCCIKCYWDDKRTLHDIACAACGILFRPTAKDRPFCSRKCYDSTRGETVVKNCIGCKNDFEIKVSISDRYKYCGIKCKNNHSKSVRKECVTCKKEFLHVGSDIARGVDRHHCSEECRRPIHLFECECCGEKSRICPGDSKRRYCSTACYRRSGKASGLEIAVSKCLDEIGIIYEPEYKIGRYSIDFAMVDHKLAIEADGDYWHDPKKDIKRDAALLSVGWSTVRIKEGLFNASPDKVLMVKALIDSAMAPKVVNGTGIKLV